MEASPMQAGTWFSLAQYSFILALAFASALIVCFALALLHILRNQRNFECSPALLGLPHKIKQTILFSIQSFWFPS